MKKLVILKHGGGELANQLWNYVSICAYGLEIGATVRNPSFYEYHHFFRFLKDESFVTNLKARLLFRKPRRRSSFINRIERRKYALRSRITAWFEPSRVYSSENSLNQATYLPPSAPLPDRLQRYDALYFTGWLFRNPKGLEKFGSALREAFKPADFVAKRVDSIIAPLREKHSKIVGVHIRQSDYAGFKGGRFIVGQKRVRETLDEYIRENSMDAAAALFLITSDGPIDARKFDGLNIHISKENSVTDLFLLSRADAVIGSDSSFGAFAAWYANVPHIIFKNEAMDWAYYKNKTSFFTNKYSELARY
ncbi:MAG TPA: hypothetical protein VHE10_00630 [Candidatus Paceibacterota bacterium]|nr:hypothetical protein [Candidatus Paceibacterota bacterium]